MTKDGQAVASSRYNLYGARKTSTDTIGNPFAYNGEARDDTGLDYLRARYYDSQGGTFLSEDSYPGEATDPLSQNRYSYVQNNPVNYTDPSGHRMVWAVDGSEPSRPRRINTRLQRFYQRSIVEQDSSGRAVSLREYTDYRIKTDRNFRAPESYYQAFGPNVATYQQGGSYGGQSSYAYTQQQAAYARAQAEQRRRQQIRYEYGLATGLQSLPTIREGLNLLRNWNTALQNTLKHVCDPKTTKSQDDARKKKLTASELQRLIKKANSGDMSAIASLSRSYDGKSGIGTGIRTKEEIEAGNRRVWQNTVDGFKKISYIIGEFFSVNDAYRLTTGKDPETGEDASRLEAAGWLTADLASLGISKVAKGGKLAGKGLKALDKVNDASKATKAADKASGNLLPMTLDNLQMFAEKTGASVSKARYGKSKLSATEYKKLRDNTPTLGLRMRVNEGISLPMNDFAIPGNVITKKLEADHIVPMKKIVTMKGFDKLSLEQQLSVLNFEENFIGLSKSANTSKGAKSYSDWTMYKKTNTPINPIFREEMIRKEAILEGKLQSMIDNFIYDK